MKSALGSIVATLIAALAFTACGSGGPVVVKESGMSNKLVGGGSSFAYPCMSRWTHGFHRKTGFEVNYQSLGSSGGVNQFMNGTLDFAASDAPMKDEQLQKSGGEILHIPVVMGAVAITYNLPGIKNPVNLSGQMVADIYLGKIKKWNDPAINAMNPGIALPAREIVLVRRADGSGTTFIFSDFLSQTSPDWKAKVGKGNGLQWPSGTIGEKGNEGVAARVQRNAYSIGYVELVYAVEAKLPVASLTNSHSEVIHPKPESVTAAAAGVPNVPEDLRLSIVNSPGKGAYPMAGITWVVARANTGNPNKAKLLKNFLEFALSDTGQTEVTKLSYSKLPQNLLEMSRAKVAQIN